MRDFVDLLMVLLTIAVTSVFLFFRTPAAEFETSRELGDFLASHGFLLQQGKTPDEPHFNFFFSDHPVDDNEIALLSCCGDCGLTPKWKGIVRVNQIRSSIGELNPTSVGGKTRIWGNVLLAGDEQLMDRVLQAVREHAPERIR